MNSCKRFSCNADDIRLVASNLANGCIIALPTETVYGLAAHALDVKALERVFQAKQRPSTDPLIIHIADFEQVEELAYTNALFYKITQRFWPGPLTIILPKKDIVPKLATANRDTVALRMPQHPIFREIIKKAGCPLAAPSANPFGYISPTSAIHVMDSLGDVIDGVVDGGPCTYGIESTIVSLVDLANIEILRPGPIGPQELESVLGRPVSMRKSMHSSSAEESQEAPGLLSRHYSPHTRVQLIEHGAPFPPLSPQSAHVYLAQPPQAKETPNIFGLSQHGSIEEAGHNLYKLLRELDTLGLKEILVEKAPNQGLGVALNDRLSRAASNS